LGTGTSYGSWSGRRPARARSNAVGFLLGASFYGYIFIGTLYMQQVLGYSAMKTGLAWLTVGVTGVALAGPAQVLATRASAKLVMAVGMTLTAAGILWATQVPAHASFWADLATRSRVLLGQGHAISGALTGGFHGALWVCGIVGLTAVPVALILVRRTEITQAAAAATPRKAPAPAPAD
jgi:hypothetical protein